jgi:hypothetical protein
VEGQAEPPFVNAGKMENKGLETLLKYSSGTKSDFSYDIGMNFTIMNNKVLELADDVDYLPGIVSNSSTRNLTISRSQVEYPIAQFYGYVVDGIFQNQTQVNNHADQPGKGVGRLRYRDLNNDEVIDDKDRTFIGNPHPRVTYGLNINVFYRRFDLGLFIQGVQGVDLFNFTRYYTDFYYDLGNRHSRILDSWTPSNTSSSIPRISSVDANNELRPSTYFIENGSYLRIRDLQIGYTIPTRLLKIQDLRVYFQAQNLLTLTAYEGMDPEVSLVNYTSERRNLDIGVDRGIYPNSMVFLVGINVQL